MARSIKIAPVEISDAGNSADGVVYPKPETMHPNLAAYVTTLLVNRAEQLHKLAEHDCNCGLSEAQERRRDKLQAEVAEIAKAVGFDVETSGDPRGCVVKLLDLNGKENGDNWGGGWGVYR